MSIFDVELFARTVRKEWMIENNLHWHLDYTLKEDASTINDNFASCLPEVLNQLSTSCK